MQIKTSTIVWLIVGFIWCIFMGITVVSIGFGSIAPGLNGIAKPFVCPVGQMEISSQQYQVSPVEHGYTLSWFCVDAKSGAKAELNVFIINFYAGAIYGALIFLVGVLSWYAASYRRGLTPQPDSAQSKKRSQQIQVLVFIAVFACGTFFTLGLPLLTGSQPLSMGVTVITPAIPTAFMTSTPQGLIFAFGGEGSAPGLFNDVRALAISPATGTIFAADYSDGRVQAFDPSGKFITEWVSGSPVTGLSADRSGNVFVATHGTILRYDSNGKLTATLSVPDDFLQHVAVDSQGNLVVGAVSLSGGVKDLILRMTPDGKVLSTVQNVFQDDGDAAAEKNVPVAVDTANDIYAFGNDAIFKLSADGKFAKRFGSAGENPPLLGLVGCIAVDDSGRVYAGGADGILVFDNNGNYLSSLAAGLIVRYIAFDAQNQMYITTNTNQVMKFSQTIPNAP
jgi:sugar lactone lactonase YvrE